MPDIANPGDLVHVHLLLNHVPTIGTILGLGLLLMGFVRRNDHLKKVSLEVFFVIAVATIPVYVSGTAGAEALKGQTGVSEAAIANHQDAALNAFVLMELTAFAAWLGLWQLRRTGRTSAAMMGTIVILSITTVAVMAWAANLGGGIRHPEILGGQYSAPVSPTSSVWLTSAAVTTFVLRNSWVWPACEALHFLGMSLMFGALMIINLQMLGVLRGTSYASVHRLLPFGILGFGVNLVTGMLFFSSQPFQYTQNVVFHWKIILLVLSGLNFLVLTVYDGAWTVPEHSEHPVAGKLLAVSMLVLSVGVMYFGRMLPFLGNSF